MTVFDRRPSLRWLVPLVAAFVLATAGSVVGVISATASGGLPDRTAAQLLVDVQKARVDGLSGTVVQNADLGLPSLPGIGGNGSSDLTSLVSGSHTLRLWYAGPDHVRLALLGSLGESDVVRQGTDLWTWSSKGKTATHRTLPASKADTPSSLAAASPTTPQQAADEALKAITPSTDVSTDGTAMVAGRNAYELVLTPADTSSLVSSVRIAIDGDTHIPTRVQVYGSDTSNPAFEVGFTDFNPTRPDASVFGFNPPPGTKVTNSSSTDQKGSTPQDKTGPGSAKPSGGQPSVVGKGWTSVVVAKVPTSSTSSTSSSSTDSGPSSLTRVLKALPVASGSWGTGHVLRGTIFSAVLTDDGRVAVGAVTPDRLYGALAGR